jgi:hypothetical protein
LIAGILVLYINQTKYTMKKVCLTMTIAGLLLCCTNIVHAQTMQTQLNQVELMKQFLGNWQCEYAKDTIQIQRITLFGTTMEVDLQIATKGKILNSGKQLWGYDKKNDKFIGAGIWKSSPEMAIGVFWFTSKNICESVPYQDISNPEKAAIRWEWEIKSPDLATCTIIINNKAVRVLTYASEK